MNYRKNPPTLRFYNIFLVFPLIGGNMTPFE